jgi:hypothetical protein
LFLFVGEKKRMMRKIEEVTGLDSLDEMWVVVEAAALLGVKTGRVHALIEEGSLPSRFASLEEIGILLATGRIKGVPGSGIRLIPKYAVESAKGRRKRGWQKGRPRRREY